jgi:hypothetical protein
MSRAASFAVARSVTASAAGCCWRFLSPRLMTLIGVFFCMMIIPFTVSLFVFT